MPRYFEFEVSLFEIKPRIWRRFLISDRAKFVDLHEAVQDAGEWLNYHLFEFCDPVSGIVMAGLPDDEYGEPAPDARKVPLSSCFDDEYRRCRYLYDFGDGWALDIKLRRIIELPKKFWRRLLAGARAFPHEDCGGVGGYEDCVLVVRGKRRPDYGKEEDEELLKWLGGWDPERFDLEAVKKRFDLQRRILHGHYDESL